MVAAAGDCQHPPTHRKGEWRWSRSQRQRGANKQVEAPVLRLRRSRVGRHGCLRGGPATTPAWWLWLFTASPGADELQPATIQAHREDQALTGAQFKNHTGALRWVAVWTRSSGILVLSRGSFRCPKLSSKVLSQGDKSSLFVPSSGPWKIRLTSNKEGGLGEWSFLSQNFARPLAWVGRGWGKSGKVIGNSKRIVQLCK